ncbi:UNVERIFIED_CONTAM: hypothetical protein Sradi_3978200 [Sesamum radiatum]|uniref:Uncharacterized protein n=1 Tax=Sesamum radiatum TaxID=300843 RepID=A0AAW2PJW5_SESRA
MQSWSARRLSQAGRAILIKSILQVIPSYAMSSFKMPEGLLSDIESSMANCFSHQVNSKKIHWLAWRKCWRRGEAVVCVEVTVLCLALAGDGIALFIGNGSNVRLAVDQWIPWPASFLLKEKVQEVFAAVDTDWIIRISVRDGGDDFLGWHFDPHRRFTVISRGSFLAGGVMLI